ncbi:transglycosylase SLT domain-containing protein [Nocardia arizonensis]|uniref:transglycosylase SLT domain-containing protein n=1 Tax=Nocardia arizonensis TaxID=1141647 RepID=UPI0006D070A4|nr:transglycosylase SLT domain-containing protein [Nocardia arizonensis]
MAQAYSAGSSRLTVNPELARNFVNQIRIQLQRVAITHGLRIVPDLSEFNELLRTRLAWRRDLSLGVKIRPDMSGFGSALFTALAPYRNISIHIRITFDHAQLLLLLALLAQLRNQFGSIGPNIGGFNIAMSLASTAATALKVAVMALVAGSLFPLISVAAQAAGTLALLPAAAATAAAGIATLVVGVSGVSAAFTAAKAMSESASRDATSQARAIAAAQRSEQQAVASLTQARKDLNTAYSEASKKLRDLALQARGAALSEADAVISLAEARRDLAALKSTDPLDYVRANKRIADAEQSLAEARARRTDVDEAAADAAAKGIENADEVVAARERIADAEQAMADARTALSEAASQQSSAVEAFERAMAKLSPSAREFVNTLRGMGDRWSAFRMAVQEPLFTGLGDSVVGLADAQMDRVRDGLAGIAEVINTGVRDILADLSTPETGAKLEKIFVNAKAAIGPLLAGVNDLLQGLLSLAGVGSDFLPDASQNFADTMANFRTWAESPDGQNKFRDFLRNSLDALGKIWDLAKAVGTALAGLVVSAEPTGESMLESLTRNVERFSAWLNSPEGRQALKDFWEDVRTTVTNLGELAVWIGQAAVKLYELFDAFRDLTSLNIFQGALFTLRDAIGLIPEAFDRIRQWVAERLPGALAGGIIDLTGFGNALDTLSTRVSEIVFAIGTTWDGLRDKMATPINWVIESVVNGGFRNIWNSIRSVLPVLPEWSGEVSLIPTTRRADGGPAAPAIAEGRVTGPGSRVSDFVPALLSRDEHVWTGAEVDGAGGHGAVARLRRAARAGHLPRFREGGGLFGSVTDWVEEKFRAVTGGLRGRIAELFLKPVQVLADQIPDFGGGIGAVPAAVLKQVSESAAQVISGQAVARSAMLPAGEAVQRWRDLAIEALKREGFDPAQVDIMLSQIQSESGGNPDIAQQIVDANGTGEAAGVGLLQIIPGTFAAHRDPTLPNDRRDPLANMVAALRYYKSRYGLDLSQMWGKGHGYDQGGVWEPGTLGWNTSGKPEAVLTSEEFRWLRDLVDAIAVPVPGQDKPGLADPARKGLGLDTWETLGKSFSDRITSVGKDFATGQLDDALSVVGAPNLSNSERVQQIQDYGKALQVFEATKAARTAGNADYQSLMNQIAPPLLSTQTAPGGPVTTVDNSTHITVQTRDVDEGYRRALQIADLRALQFTARKR